eukprot:1232495-Alexandrium_andersonii.AAC.1
MAAEAATAVPERDRPLPSRPRARWAHPLPPRATLEAPKQFSSARSQNQPPAVGGTKASAGRSGNSRPSLR